jgi:hypothetical protein
MVAAEFARFLGLAVRRSSNITDLIEDVVGVCTDTRTGLVLVDELHNISLTSRTGAEVADTLKYFSERIPATFIYAGIDIEHSTHCREPVGSRLRAASPSFPRPRSPTTPNGRAWPPRSRAPCSFTVTTPAPSPAWLATCMTGPAA